jgi:hypothetical protein
MASTTYEHFVDTNKMYAAQEQFRNITKTSHLGNANKMATKCHRFGALVNMVRNAGQLPQPFWLGATCGGGSHSLSASVARA